MVIRSASIVIVGALLLAACGGGDTATSGGSTSEAEGPTAINPSEDETVAENEEYSADRGRLGSEIADSDTDPQDFRGEVGKQVSYDCPAEGVASVIWGIETYTDDSSVCTAAVHVGLLTFAIGGTVLIEIADGQDSYASGSAHDVDSRSYANWAGSFFFPDAPPGSGAFDTSNEGWSETAQSNEVGDVFEIECSSGGTPSGVWGSGVYTSDSSICTAAVHAGVIDQSKGGGVTVTVVEGVEGYIGSEANGVTSADWPSYPLSFTVS